MCASSLNTEQMLVHGPCHLDHTLHQMERQAWERSRLSQVCSLGLVGFSSCTRSPLIMKIVISALSSPVSLSWVDTLESPTLMLHSGILCRTPPKVEMGWPPLLSLSSSRLVARAFSFYQDFLSYSQTDFYKNQFVQFGTRDQGPYQNTQNLCTRCDVIHGHFIHPLQWYDRPGRKINTH